MTRDWTERIVGQLEFYWDVHLWPRLQGLTNEEYLWKPVEGMWSLSEHEGNWVLDGGWDPDSQPATATTIAWRMMHIAAPGLHNRAQAFFGDDPHPDLEMNDWRRMPTSLPTTADAGVAFLAEKYRWWHDGIAGLDDESVLRPLGPKGGEYAKDSMADLIIHLNREIMHHGGEIGVLRDLYRAGLR